ncbi:hypothetical protein [Nitrosomonas ureae]|uniref:hypothetical protein n=1 Tax=Nitrosomonas ureae TaxID=44577 RepID=UPI000722DD77|nr:hypothetical protein [Nitrosomonas ureae]ALQ49773.1 hypothetical protein ATY38_00010 [Nitrosomonas ureae]
MSTIQQETLAAILRRLLQNKLINLQMQRGELTIVVNAEDILGVSKVLRDDTALMFDTLIDCAGLIF